MKRMVKNGDLIDVEPDGTITVAGKPIGGGENERELTINLDYSSNQNSYPMSVTLPEDTINKIDSVYYDKIRFFYNDGNPAGTFLGTKIYFSGTNGYNTGTYKGYVCLSKSPGYVTPSTWYGKDYMSLRRFKLSVNKMAKTILIEADYDDKFVPMLDKSKFDALYKLADKPTQNGTYVLKATVSGGSVTYTWVAE